MCYFLPCATVVVSVAGEFAGHRVVTEELYSDIPGWIWGIKKKRITQNCIISLSKIIYKMFRMISQSRQRQMHAILEKY